MPKTPGKCIAVFAKHGASHRQDSWRNVVELLLNNQFKVLVSDSMLNARNMTAAKQQAVGFKFASIEEIRKKADYAVIMGGDGTFLGNARKLADTNIPLLGINQGRLGFLTDIRSDDIDPTLIDTLNGDSIAESRHYLTGQVLRNGKVIADHIALNDVVISRGIVGGMVELRVEVDGHFMYDLRADGLIVSTPTGSTAYALSADGPILHPSLAGIVIVPVAPHALTNRPIALPQHCSITITVTGGKQTGVHFDMHTNERAKVGDQVRIEVSEKPIHLLHPGRYDYFAMLRQKLHWSATPTEVGHRTRGLRDSGHAK
ncbi:MAG TPA: NAD(+)/NADH kinase [Limnobacter sp.]|uniref:NAD(+)/NADH kinase n=1 Tax=Limnobacter sp. TaxID=2003368 RepID=UPI002EDA89D9